MMHFIRWRLLRVDYPYDLINARRARLLLVISWAALFAAILWLVFALLPFSGIPEAARLNSVLLGGLFLLACLLIVRLTKTGALRIARWILVAMLMIAVAGWGLFQTPSGVNLSDGIMLSVALPIVAAGVLLERRGMAAVSAIMALMILLVALGQSQLTLPVSYVPANDVAFDLPVNLILVLLVGGFLFAATGTIERIASRALTNANQREWLIQFTGELARIEDENAMLVRAVTGVREQLGYLVVQIALMDDTGSLSRVLRVGMGQEDSAPRPLPRLPETSILVEAAHSQQVLTTNPADSSNRRSHMLSAALSAAALPLVFNGRTYGVLDIQSAEADAFSHEVLMLLSLVADQIAVVFHNVRQRAEYTRGLRDREAVNARLEEQLQEFRQRERRGVSSAWGSYVQGRGKKAIGFDLVAEDLKPAEDLPDGIQTTLRTGELQVEMQGQEQVIHVPIKFRDQTLGAMAFVLPRDQALTEREIEMTNIVSERLALALENTRLFEQSQAQATRERKASEITSLLIGATDVRSVLDLAADQFREAMGAVHTHIYIQPDVLVEPLAPLSDGSGEEGSR